MSFFEPIDNSELEFDGFYDGQQRTIPDNHEATALVYDGFNGMEEGKATQACYINIVLTSGEFKGQKYRYNAKIYDPDAGKRDQAKKNLQVVDAQAGFPMTDGRLDLTEENIQKYWVNKAEVRVRMGLLIGEDDGKEINFVRGFGYLREKMLPRRSMQQAQVQQSQQPQPGVADIDDDIPF